MMLGRLSKHISAALIMFFSLAAVSTAFSHTVFAHSHGSISEHGSHQSTNTPTQHDNHPSTLCTMGSVAHAHSFTSTQTSQRRIVRKATLAEEKPYYNRFFKPSQLNQSPSALVLAMPNDSPPDLITLYANYWI